MPGGDKTYKVGKDVYTIPEKEAAGFLKDFPDAAEVKSFTSGKDTFDIPIAEVENFLKEVPTAKELGQSQPKPEPKQTPLHLDNVASSTAGLIQPVGTHQSTPKQNDLASQLTNGGKVENGVVTVHDNKVAKSSKPDIGLAIDNLVSEKNKGISVSKEAIKVQKDAIAQAYKNGDLTLSADGKLKKGTGFIQSFLDANNNRFVDDIHNNILASLDNKGKRDYLKIKPLLDEKYKSNSEPNGLLGKAGQFAGENAELLGKGALVAGTAGAALPEVAGAGSVGSFISMANQLAKGGYASGMEKTYNELVQQGVPEEQAMDEAHKSGLVSEATNLATGAFLSKGHIQAKPEAAKGLIKGIMKSASKSMGYEAPKMAAVSGAQTFVNDLAELGVGVNKKPEDILKEVGESAGHGAVIGSAFWALQNPGKILSYLRPQAENVIASMPKEQREAYVKSAQQSGLMPEGSVEVVEKKVQEFEKAKAPVENLPIPEENKAAIAGKILQKQKLQDELSNLQKHGEAFAPRIEELTNEIAGLEKEMGSMYKAKDVFSKEADTLTGETTKDETTPEQTNPTEQSGQAADLAENSGAATVVPEPITQEQAAIDHKEATDLGFNNVHEAMGSVNKRTGEKYTKFQDIPKDVLEKVSKDRQVQPVEYTTKSGTYKYSVEEGVPIVRNIKTGENVIKVTYKTEKKGNKTTVKKVVTGRNTFSDVMKEAAESYDFTKGSTAPDPDFEPANQEEYLKHVIEKTTSPVELANIYLGEEKVGKGLSTKDQMIANYGMGKVTEDSYRNFADKNSQNHNKSRAYFSKDGSPIDALAKEMSDHYGVDISPEDVTGFIDRFPNGAESAAAMNETGIAKEAKDRFSELTGLPLTEDIADIAVNQHFEKLSKEAQEIAQQDYETEQQLRDEYDRYLAEQDNADNAAKETATGEVGDGAGEEINKPITNRQRAEEIAQKVLSFRSDGNSLYGGIAGVTTAIYDGMLSSAANVIRLGGSVLDAIDAGLNYVKSNSPKADLEKVKEFLHSAFNVPYSKPTATPNALMQGKNIADTGVRIEQLDKARDLIEQGVKEKKLSLWDKFAKQTFEGQQEILKRLKSLGQKGQIVADFLITSKGSTAKADAFFDHAKEAIYGGLDGLKKVVVAGKEIRIQALLNKVITLRRIIDIDKKMESKFSQFNYMRKQLNAMIKANPNDPQIIQLTRDYENVKEYLDYNDMLVYDKATDSYSLGQYRHPLGYTSDFATADLQNIEKDQPELYKKLHDRATLLSDTFHKLIDLKEENGILSKESADALREYYYAPRADIEKYINSETDNTAGGSGNPVKDRVNIKRLQGGSESVLEDNYDTQLHKAVLNTMRDVALNSAGKKLLEAVRENPDTPFFYENTPQIHQVGPNKGKLIRDQFGGVKYDEIPAGMASIKVWDKGKVVQIVGDQRLVDSWYDKQNASSFASQIGKYSGAKILRGAITGYNPGFGVFQLLVDPQSAVVASGLYKSYLVGLGEIYKDMIKVSPHVFNAKGVSGIAAEARDYGAFSSFSRGEDVLNLRSDVDVSKRKARRALRATAEAFNWVNDRAENLTRTALYARSKEQQIAAFKKDNGKDPLGQDLEDIKNGAAADARKYVDFARGGDFAKEANKVFPYLNAAIQLKRSVITAAAKNPVRFATMTAEAVSAGLGVMAYSLGLGWASHGLSDDEKRKRLEAYRNVNNVTRAKYFLLYKGEDKDGKPQFWRLEKPMLLNVAINAAENAMVKHYYKDVELNNRTFAQDLSDQLPIDRTILSRNPVINSSLKYFGNKDWYFNTEVVKNADNITDYLEGLDNKKTKDFYIWLGQKAKDAGVDEGISPMRSQAAVESFIGDPTQNPIVNLLTSTMAIGFDAALGNKKALNDRMKSFGEIGNYLDFTTMPKRLIVQPSDITIEELKDWKNRNQIKGDRKVLRKAALLGRTQ